jgi:hypothetical protein
MATHVSFVVQERLRRIEKGFERGLTSGMHTPVLDERINTSRQFVVEINTYMSERPAPPKNGLIPGMGRGQQIFLISTRSDCQAIGRCNNPSIGHSRQ